MHYKTCEICGLKAGRVLAKKRIFMAKFPLDEDRCKEWVKATGNEDLAYIPIEKLHQLKYICGKHFRPKDFKKKNTQLKLKAVPSVLITAEPLRDEILSGFPLHIHRSRCSHVETSTLACVTESSTFTAETTDIETANTEIPCCPNVAVAHMLEHNYCRPNSGTPSSVAIDTAITAIYEPSTSIEKRNNRREGLNSPIPVQKMATVQNMETKRIALTDNHRRDEMNNEISSSSSESPTADPIAKFNTFYRAPYIQSQSDNEDLPRSAFESSMSLPLVRNAVPAEKNQQETRQLLFSKQVYNKIDIMLCMQCFHNEGKFHNKRSVTSRNHYKSMGNINDIYTEVTTVQNSISNIDLNLHSTEIKKFETLRIPIVGYEVMEERARFTIYKLKVEDDNRDKSWLVFRRYTDFVRLYNRVKTQQPNLILPLPGKRWFRDNFEPAFLEERVRGLQIFVNAILSKLPNHPVVREFFCLDEPPQVFSYQPEVQAVYGALEDSISTLKVQLKQKDATIMHLQKRVSQLEEQVKNCPTCSKNKSANL